MLWCTSTAPSWQVLYPLLRPKWVRISLSFPQEFLPVSLTSEAATGQFRATKEKDYLQQIHSKLHDANEATFRKLFHSNRMRDWRPAVPQAQVLTTEGKIDHQLMLYSHSQNNFHPPPTLPKLQRAGEMVGSLLLVLARFCHLNTSEVISEEVTSIEP